MRTIAFFALLGLLAGLASAQLCPPVETLAPCVCFEANKTVECKDIRGRFNLKQIFDGASSSVGDDVIFDTLTIHNTPVVEILEGTFESWRFVNVEIRLNEHLVYVSPNAFNASRDITEKLVIAQNYIDNEAPYEDEIFQLARSFKNLVSVQISSNELSSIPENAFQGLPLLESISLTANKIAHIGSNAFSNLPKLKSVILQYNEIVVLPSEVFANLPALEEVEMWYNPTAQIGSRAFYQTPSLKTVDMYRNSIPSEGLAPDAFEGIGPNATVDMRYNGPMEFLERESFQVLLNTAGKVAVGGSSCSRNGCSFRRLYCDERVDWICDNLEEYEGKLSGYMCYDGLGMIADYCANRVRKVD